MQSFGDGKRRYIYVNRFLWILRVTVSWFFSFFLSALIFSHLTQTLSLSYFKICILIWMQFMSLYGGRSWGRLTGLFPLFYQGCQFCSYLGKGFCTETWDHLTIHCNDHVAAIFASFQEGQSTVTPLWTSVPPPEPISSQLLSVSNPETFTKQQHNHFYCWPYGRQI